MKLIILVAAIALTHGAKLEKTYLPPSNARSSGGSGSFLQTPLSGPASNPGFTPKTFGQNYNQYQGENEYAQPTNVAQAQYNNVNGNFGSFGNSEARPERTQAALERNAAILRSDNNNDGETYSYAFETQNGIYAEESGVATNGVEAQGGFSYTGDDGRVYSIRYTADQNGFVPQGDHLPTPPPVPVEILKALEQNARDEAAGIYDDGSYNEAKYADASNQYTNYQTQNGFNSYGNGDDDSIITNSALTRSSGNFNSLNSFSRPQSSSRTDVTGSQRGSVTAAYLPPFSQRASARNSGRQNFDARTGYNY